MKNLMKELIIGGVRASVPIIQGGMGVVVSISGLASAVANEGGIGVISATGIGMLEADFYSDFSAANQRVLKKEIRKAKSKTSGVIGVNLMIALSDYDKLLKTAYEEEVNIVFVGAGLPLRLPKDVSIDTVKNSTTRFVPIVSSGRAAEIIFASWAKNYNHVPDAIVVEGPKAGGHLGFKIEQIDNPEFALEKILPEVLKVAEKYSAKFEKNIPVIAAGGIYSGADIYRYISMGASGVQLGSRFAATVESDASDEFKQKFLNCKEEDLIIIKSPVGLPGRAINNEFLQKIAAGFKHKFTCPCQCLKSCNFSKAPYCIALALVEACSGNMNEGFAFAGANSYLIDKIISVRELFEELIEGFNRAACQDQMTASC